MRRRKSRRRSRRMSRKIIRRSRKRNRIIRRSMNRQRSRRRSRSRRADLLPDQCSLYSCATSLCQHITARSSCHWRDSRAFYSCAFSCSSRLWWNNCMHYRKRVVLIYKSKRYGPLQGPCFLSCGGLCLRLFLALWAKKQDSLRMWQEGGVGAGAGQTRFVIGGH